MRILHVNTTSRRAGGAEGVLYDLQDWQRAHGHEVGLFAGHTDEAEDTAERRVVVRPEWEATRLITDPELEEACGEFLRSFAPDVVHIHNLSSFPVRIVDVLAASGVPLIQHLHDASSFCANSWMVHHDGQVCEGGVGAKCLRNGCEKNYPFDGRILLSTRLRTEQLRASLDGWIATSQAYAELAGRHGFDPIEVIPCWSPSDPPTPPPPRPDKRVLFVGRLVREKGTDVLLRAWPKVLERVPDARLEIVGEGPERGELEALASSLGLDPQQVFQGRVEHGAVHRHMLAARALVFPSIWFEAFGLISVEAFRAGLPVVASRIGGIPEVVRDQETGLLVPPRDPEALAAAVVRCLTDDDFHARLVAECLVEAEARRDDAPLHAVQAFYERTIERGIAHRTDGSRAPGLHPDLVASADTMMHDFGRVERWALDMRGHIDYLEANGTATEPVRSFAKHVRARLRKRFGR